MMNHQADVPRSPLPIYQCRGFKEAGVLSGTILPYLMCSTQDRLYGIVSQRASDCARCWDQPPLSKHRLLEERRV